jgi:hypothetical protein
MWNRSYRWQRHSRLAAGALVLVALLAGMIAIAGTAPAERARAGARDLVREISSSDRVIKVTVPSALEARSGTLVYREREDGGARVIGRVITVDAREANQVELSIRLVASPAGETSRGGTIKGAPATLDLRDAVRLLINPGTPADEAALARDTIWPSVQAHVLPGLVDGLIRETSNELASLDREDEALLAKTVERLREVLQPIEDKLVDRLAKRTWDTIGVQGLAAGIWRKTAEDVQKRSLSVAEWAWRLLGSKPAPEPAERPFFSDETMLALRTALEQETLDFWSENRSTIINALKNVILERRDDFEAAFKERWAGLLYQRAVLPAWEAGKEKVLDSIQDYAHGFAERRLLTKNRGPRLMFAFALRSSLDISDDPLLVFVPATDDATDRVVYEPLLR